MKPHHRSQAIAANSSPSLPLSASKHPGSNLRLIAVPPGAPRSSARSEPGLTPFTLPSPSHAGMLGCLDQPLDSVSVSAERHRCFSPEPSLPPAAPTHLALATGPHR